MAAHPPPSLRTQSSAFPRRPGSISPLLRPAVTGLHVRHQWTIHIDGVDGRRRVRQDFFRCRTTSGWLCLPAEGVIKNDSRGFSRHRAATQELETICARLRRATSHRVWDDSVHRSARHIHELRNSGAERLGRPSSEHARVERGSNSGGIGASDHARFTRRREQPHQGLGHELQQHRLSRMDLRRSRTSTCTGSISSGCWNTETATC